MAQYVVPILPFDLFWYYFLYITSGVAAGVFLGAGVLRILSWYISKWARKHLK